MSASYTKTARSLKTKQKNAVKTKSKKQHAIDLCVSICALQVLSLIKLQGALSLKALFKFPLLLLVLLLLLYTGHKTPSYLLFFCMRESAKSAVKMTGAKISTFRPMMCQRHVAI